MGCAGSDMRFCLSLQWNVPFAYSVPMKRLGTSEEVVKSVAFLFSDDASYTTGINIVVDGGMSGGLKA